MSPENLAPLQRRLLALGILVCMASVAASLVIVPYTLVVERYESQLQRLNEKLEIHRALVRDGDAARNQQRSLDRLEAANQFFITSDKPALASAELQRRVKLVIEQSGGSVVSSQMMGEKTSDGIVQLVLRVQMRCGVEELRTIFHTLESKSPILVLDNIYVAARPAGMVTPAREKSGQQQLDIRFDVAGYRKMAQRDDIRADEGQTLSRVTR